VNRVEDPNSVRREKADRGAQLGVVAEVAGGIGVAGKVC
jgi:hypothetical protein